MDKVLVTGATGFTGGKLAQRLVGDGHEVVAFVRPSSETKHLDKLGVECRTVDIRDAKDVMDNFAGIQKVFHIAAAYRSEHADRGEFRAVNVDATRNLLDAADRYGIDRFIHCSTVGVQGEIEAPPGAEDYRLKPGDHYQESKLDGECLALEYSQSGLPISVVRPVEIYGPGDTRFLRLFRPIHRGRFVIVGTGEWLYHITYIGDLVDGFILAGERPEALGELVDTIADVLGRPRPRLRVPFIAVYWASVICDNLCRAIHVSPPLYPRRVEFFHLDRAFSTDKAQQLLGYQPKVCLSDGVARTAAWCRHEGLL